LGVFAAVVVLWLGLTVSFPELTGLWFARNVILQEVPWPKRTRLVVDMTGDRIIAARGEDVVIEAHALGVQPRRVNIFYETASGRRGREIMVTIGNPGSYRYRHAIKGAREDFTFYLQGGDDRTGLHRVSLVDRPAVRHSEMRVLPPAYAGIEPYALGDKERSAQVLSGGKVEIRIRANKPVMRAVLMTGDEVVSQATQDGPWRVAVIRPAETRTYHFALVDEVGLENRSPTRFSIRVIRDEPPRVRMELGNVGDMITPEAVVPISLECRDEYGLSHVELTTRVMGGDEPERLIPLPTFQSHAKSFRTSAVWQASSEKLVPGDRVALSVRAADLDDIDGPNVAQSPDLSLRVVEGDELLSELARRERECRVGFERTVDMQEQLRRELLSVLDHSREGGPSQELSSALVPLERRQRRMAGSVNLIRQQLESILSELQVNRLDSLSETARLRDAIIEPLARLAKRELIAASDAIREWSRDQTAEIASLVDSRQVEVLSQMHAVLARMIQAEAYHELVDMLRDIIRLQEELSEETAKRMSDSAGDVFED
jgi:hypothetical protein